MKIWGNKKVVFLCFDKTDCETLEEYLNEMAKKGWLLTKIKNYHLTFVKTDKINLKYNVDPLGNNFDGDSYVDKITYIKYCKDHNWEYVCGNNLFQISTSEESNKEKIKSKSEESIKSLFIKDVISLVALILLYYFVFKYEGFYLGGSYMDSVSNYTWVGFYAIGILAFIYLCIDLILSIIWYINYFIKKEFKYKKYTSGEEFNTWGAKEIYIDKSTKERIIVYDNVILMLNMEGDYNNNKINFIKEKLLNL